MKRKKATKSIRKTVKHVNKKRLLKTFGLLLALIVVVAFGLFLIQQYNSKYPAEGIAGKAYSDLTSEQKQVYWGCYKEKSCGVLLNEAQKSKNYASYRTCSKDCHAQALSYSPKQDYCQDSDGIDYFTAGNVTSNLYPQGKEDYCLEINGKNYLFEGKCVNNKAQWAQKSCKELGEYGCEGGKCIPKINQNLFDENGRLTNYALSLAPPLLKLNLNEPTKLYPEKYGNNYFKPGNYNINIGDGFGKNDFLIKFVEFNVDEQRIYFEVFKKEANGNFYHFPTDENFIYKNEIKDLFGIPLESLSDSLNPVENILTYHPNCTVFYDYCYEEGNYFYAGNSIACNWRCVFDANTDETKSEKGIFSSIYPKNYSVLANFSVALLEQCYNNDIDFLKYNPQKPRVGIKVLLGSSGPLTGADEYVYTQRSEANLNDEVKILDFLNTEKNSKNCPNYMALGHELTHTLTKEMLGNNYGLNEGLADFVAFQNGFEKKYACLDNGWKDVYDSVGTINAYVNLSTNPGDVGSSTSLHYYATGYCFWTDFVKEHGYPNFVKFMQKSYQKSRGIEQYYLTDVIGEVINAPSPAWVSSKYGLTKDSTLIEPCKKCGVLVKND